MYTSSKVAIFGAAGMLGGDVVDAFDRSGWETHSLDRAACDITDPAQCRAILERTLPNTVVNCAAYTDVNGAESEQEQAHQVNALGAENVARACAEFNVRCVYISTDYVFDGTQPAPYLEDDVTGPLSVYGATKLEGEQRTAAACADSLIVRTSWVYGMRGNNFVKIMLTLASEGRVLRIVDDQQGAPTYTRDLADCLTRLAANPARGVVHATGGGSCSWFEFAAEIFKLTGIQPSRLEPITTQDYPTPARRPTNSRLANDRLHSLRIDPLPDWRDALHRYLAEAGMLK